MTRPIARFDVFTAIGLAWCVDRALVAVVRAFKGLLFGAGAGWYEVFIVAELPAILCGAVALVVSIRYLLGSDDRTALGRTGLMTLRIRPLTAALLGMVAYAAVTACYFEAAGAWPVLKPNPDRRLLYVLAWPVFKEELLFRGFMLRLLLMVISARSAIMVSAVLYTASHHVLFAMNWNLPHGGWLAVSAVAQWIGFGMLTGWLYVRGGGCLAACMLTHLPGDYQILVSGELSPGRSPNWWAEHGNTVAYPAALFVQAMVVWIVMRGGRISGRASASG